jgi:hypothetical protein
LGFCIDDREDLIAFFGPISDDDVDDSKKRKINIEIVSRIINDLVIGHHVKGSFEPEEKK